MKQLNKIREKIKEGTPVIGTHIKTSDATIVEFFGLAGLDFVWLDGEHPAMNIETAQRNMMAAQGAGMAAFYRVPWNDPVLVKPILDMGMDGVIFPMIRTKEEAQLAVSSCLYPPEGIRGFGPIRDSGYGLFNLDWILENARNVWKIMQIEHYEAVDNLEEIMAVKGVDALTVGTCDLSASMGIPGQVNHPDVLAKLDELAQKALKAGMPFSISTGYNREAMEQWVNRGINWLVVGGEYDFMNAGLQKAMKEARELFAARK